MDQSRRRMDLVGQMHPDTGLISVEAGVWIAVMDESITGSAYIEEEAGLSMHWVTEREFLGFVQRGKMN